MKTIEKFPQTKADFKTTEKDQALTTKNMNDLFFDVIIEQIQALETAHWEHFLKNEASILPMNRVSLQRYTRLNQMILSLDILINKRTTAFYATFNQISQAKGKIRKGSKSIPIQYFSYDIKHLQTNERLTIDAYKLLTYEQKKLYSYKSFIKYYRVFSLDAIENIADCTFADLSSDVCFDLNNDAECLINDLMLNKNLRLSHLVQGDAFYKPSTDEIHMPKISFFKDAGFYYATLFHELIHWTGHQSRLNRFDVTFEDGRNTYAFEELVAELGSLLFSQDFNYQEQFYNSICYLKSWLKHTEVSKQNSALEEAFLLANRAVKFIKN